MLKNNRAASIDGVTEEMIKHGFALLMDWLSN